MELQQLEENKVKYISNVLEDVFGVKFNFSADTAKLQAISEATTQKIESLRDSGIDVSAKDFQKLILISEGLEMTIKSRKLEESADLDQAEVLLAAKQMADDLQKMAENLASMQVEDLMSITNAMKEELGTAEAEAFSSTAELAIAAALEAVKSANEGVNNAVLAAQGQPVETDIDNNMGAEPDMDVDMGAEMDMDVDMEPEDDFEGASAADSMSDADGREMKEDAYLKAVKMVKEAQREGKVSTDLLKQAFAQLKN